MIMNSIYSLTPKTEALNVLPKKRNGQIRKHVEIRKAALRAAFRS